MKSTVFNKVKLVVFNRVTKLWERKYGWSGNYSTWNKAKRKCKGYDAANILEKVKRAALKVKMGEAVYERDSVVFDKLDYCEPLLNALLFSAKENNNRLCVIDFGGSLGSSYFQYKELLKGVTDITWCVVEQPHFVKCGREFFEDDSLKFYYSIDEALKYQKPFVILLSSVLQYLEKPYEMICKVKDFEFNYIIIDRTAFVEDKDDRITVQAVWPEIYEASYPAWFFNESSFLKNLSPEYELQHVFNDVIDPPILIDGVRCYWKGFVFKSTK